MEEKLEAFSDRISQLRKEKKVKQKEMAALLGCTERHYQKIEYGKVNVSATMLMTLSDFFEVTTDYLLGRTNER